MRWIDRSTNEAEFLVQYQLCTLADGCQNLPDKHVVDPRDSQPEATGLTVGTVIIEAGVVGQYCFQVRAANSAGRSGPSNGRCAAITTRVPHVVGLLRLDAGTVVRAAGLVPHYIGLLRLIGSQFPSAGAIVARGSEVSLATVSG